jgi:hypothetical protein
LPVALQRHDAAAQNTAAPFVLINVEDFASSFYVLPLVCPSQAGMRVYAALLNV